MTQGRGVAHGKEAAMFEILPTTRLRRSPYYEATLAAGVRRFTSYNQMLLPMGYGDPEGEY